LLVSLQSVLLGVDEAGQYLLACGQELVLGHARGRAVDLPFLANVPLRHARFELRQSFLGGAAWKVCALSDEPIRRNEEALPAGGADLRDGDRLEFAPNLELLFQLPDQSSSSALLSVRRGADCAGATRIVLVAPGAGGRIRIGSAVQRHVRVPNFGGDCEVVWNGAALEFASKLGVSLPAGGAHDSQSVAFPPRERCDLAIGRASGGRPPLWLSLEPLLYEEGLSTD
jgi:hypothetical protein